MTNKIFAVFSRLSDSLTLYLFEYIIDGAGYFKSTGKGLKILTGGKNYITNEFTIIYHEKRKLWIKIWTQQGILDFNIITTLLNP